MSLVFSEVDDGNEVMLCSNKYFKVTGFIFSRNIYCNILKVYSVYETHQILSILPNDWLLVFLTDYY